MTAPHPRYQSDPRVDYIDALPGWQQATCRRLRDLIHATDPELTETFKRTVQPYFVLDGNVYALLAPKNHVTVGHENKTARMISFYRGDTINEPALTRDVQADRRQQSGRRLAQTKSAQHCPLKPRLERG